MMKIKDVIKILTILFFILLFMLIKTLFKHNATNVHEFTFHRLPELDYKLELATLMELYKGKTMIHIGFRNELFAFTTSVIERWPSINKYYAITNEKIKRITDQKSLENKFVLINKDTIEDASNNFDDYSVDLIYLDDKYDYCTVTSYLKKYWPKLRYGGIMSGSNYVKNTKKDVNIDELKDCSNGKKQAKYSQINGVNEAVSDFLKDHYINELKFTSEDDNQDSPTFYFMKRI